MDRREFFLKTGLITAAMGASPSADMAIGGANLSTEPLDPNGSMTLSNEFLSWNLKWMDKKLASSGFENKLSGHTFEFSSCEEVVLTFSASTQRVEIPWWKFAFSPDISGAAPDEEQGLRLGYQHPEFKDEDWGAVDNLLLRSASGVKNPQDPIRYNGYGWFRKWIKFGEVAQGKPLVFVLGGYDHQDWNEYWIYLNGREIGHRAASGRWRSPGQFNLSAGDAVHTALRFGEGENNLLAVRTRGYDRRFGGHSDEVLRHYVFEPVLADQFVSVGSPYLAVSDFEIRDFKRPDSTSAVFDLQSSSQGIQVTTHYRLDGQTRRKWLEIGNTGQKELLLLDVLVDDFTSGVPVTEGGPGEPVFLADEAFSALDHPAGLNQGDNGRIRLMHFPARKINPGGKARTHVALLSVAKAGKSLDHFIEYVQDRSPRKKQVISLYTPYGINDQGGACSPLNDEEAINILEVLEKWQKKGLKFDYFTLDQGWMDSAGDLTQYAPQCYPDGPAKMVERVKSLGMKYGIWFSTSGGSWSCGDNPEVWPSLTPLPGDPPQRVLPSPVYRDGYVLIGEVSHKMCIASEPYFSILRNAVLYHIKNSGLKLFKLDMGNYYCNSTLHNHLPGKYSVEAMYEALLDIASKARQADPEICIVWYWGVRSPFFALHGDTVFESGLLMEGSGTSWFPTLYYRDSVTLNLDQSTQFAKTLPPINKDSLGVWLAENRWGNYMANERWREALIMDLGRGNLVFPQIWGDIYLLNDKDVEFLTEMCALVKKNESLFLHRRNILGDPWKNEIYGYAHVHGARGFLFINNVHFEARKARLNLAELGLEAPPGTPVEIVSQFPEKQALVPEDRSKFDASDTAEVWMRPFETLMLEISAGQETGSNLPKREVDESQAAALGRQLSLVALPGDGGMDLRFIAAAQFEKRGLKQKVQAWTTTLPQLSGGRHILAITVKLREGSKEWRYSPTVVEIVQAVAQVGGHELKLIPVPDSRQFGNTQGMGCSWIVYKVRLNSEWSGKILQFAVHSYIPDEVEAHVEAWVVNRWWEENTRPIGDGQYGNAIA